MVKHKFNAKRVVKDSISFPSKLEKKYYDLLKIMQRTGEVVFFLRQVGFDLPGGVRYFADFLVFYRDGSVEVVDVKGIDTPISNLKRKQVEELYPIQIKIVSKF